MDFLWENERKSIENKLQENDFKKSANIKDSVVRGVGASVVLKDERRDWRAKL